MNYNSTHRHFILFSAAILFFNTATFAQWTLVGKAGFTPGRSNYISFQFDNNNVPYVAFQDGGNFYGASIMKYAVGSWNMVGAGNISDGFTTAASLTFDNANTPFDAYTDYVHGIDASASSFNGTSWVTAGDAFFSAGAAGNTTIAADKTGNVYVGYIDEGLGYFATVRKLSGSIWSPLGSTGFSDKIFNSYSSFTMAVDPTGTPYIAYEDQDNFYELSVEKWNGSSWEFVGSPGISQNAAQYISIAFNKNGDPYVAYQDVAHSFKTTVKMWNGSAWITLGGVGFTPSFAYYTSIAVNSKDTPYVAFSDGADSNATVMSYDGSKWNVVGKRGFSSSFAKYTQVAIGSNDTVYAAFEDYGQSDTGATVMKYIPPPPLGIKPVVNNNFEMKVIPNPGHFYSNLIIDMKQNDHLQLSIISATGNLVKELPDVMVQPGEQSVHINLSGLAAGNYLIEVTSKKQGKGTIPFAVE